MTGYIVSIYSTIFVVNKKIYKRLKINSFLYIIFFDPLVFIGERSGPHWGGGWKTLCCRACPYLVVYQYYGFHRAVATSDISFILLALAISGRAVYWACAG